MRAPLILLGLNIIASEQWAALESIPYLQNSSVVIYIRCIS
jgi:hypothetical protein